MDINRIKKEISTKAPPGSISGMILTVLGYCGLGAASVILIPVLLFTLFSGGAYAPLGISLGLLCPLLFLSTFMLIKGTSSRGRVKRFKQYMMRIGKRNFCSVKELEEAVSRNDKFVVKDLKLMLHKGFFPEGELSQEETYLLMNSTAKEAYKKLQDGLRLQEEEKEKKRREEEKQRILEEENPALKDVNAVIAKEEKTIQKIREANKAISGEVISQKLDRLERIVSKIFDYMRKNPDQISEFRKFMGYYLPTTLKLVDTYRDLDGEEIQGENIKVTKAEIEASLDTINQGLEKLYNNFFQGVAMDVSTDISVLQTVLTQEGLIEKDFY
ncbi:MAG: 5-bromo-4-chloroindolyl phosphate hydrolysis family protein [Eubacteriaceae bacterium]